MDEVIKKIESHKPEDRAQNIDRKKDRYSYLDYGGKNKHDTSLNVIIPDEYKLTTKTSKLDDETHLLTDIEKVKIELFIKNKEIEEKIKSFQNGPTLLKQSEELKKAKDVNVIYDPEYIKIKAAIKQIKSDFPEYHESIKLENRLAGLKYQYCINNKMEKENKFPLFDDGERDELVAWTNERNELKSIIEFLSTAMEDPNIIDISTELFISANSQTLITRCEDNIKLYMEAQERQKTGIDAAMVKDITAEHNIADKNKLINEFKENIIQLQNSIDLEKEKLNALNKIKYIDEDKENYANNATELSQEVKKIESLYKVNELDESFKIKYINFFIARCKAKYASCQIMLTNKLINHKKECALRCGYTLSSEAEKQFELLCQTNFNEAIDQVNNEEITIVINTMLKFKKSYAKEMNYTFTEDDARQFKIFCKNNIDKAIELVESENKFMQEIKMKNMEQANFNSARRR